MTKQVLILLLAITMVGCATSRPTISNSTNHEREHSNKQSHVEQRVDSTIIDRLREVIIRNDTVYIRDSVYVEKYRDRNVTDTIIDTLYINNTDTITVPIEVEKPIAPFVRNSCITLWTIVGVAILALVVWIVWGFATGKFSWTNIIKWIFSRK